MNVKAHSKIKNNLPSVGASGSALGSAFTAPAGGAKDQMNTKVSNNLATDNGLLAALIKCKAAVENTNLPPSARMELVRDYATPAILAASCPQPLAAEVATLRADYVAVVREREQARAINVELLAALKHLESAVTASDGCGHSRVEIVRLAQARAAIARAERGSK